MFTAPYARWNHRLCRPGSRHASFHRCPSATPPPPLTVSRSRTQARFRFRWRAAYTWDDYQRQRQRAAAAAANNTAGQNGDAQETVTVNAREVSTDELKSQLLALATEINRGLAATRETRSQIMALVRQLERRAPAEDDAQRRAWLEPQGLAIGDWQLLYTSGLDVLWLGLLTSPLTPQIGAIYQNIMAGATPGRFRVDNVVQWHAPSTFLWSLADIGDSQLTLRVSARGDCDTTRASRLQLSFEQVAVEPVSLFGRPLTDVLSPLRTSLPQRRPVGYIDFTYLDEQLRVVRSATNDVFVLWRAESANQPTSSQQQHPR